MFQIQFSRFLGPIFVVGAIGQCSQATRATWPNTYPASDGPKETCDRYLLRSNAILRDETTNLREKSARLFSERRQVQPRLLNELPLATPQKEIDERFALLQAVESVDKADAALPPDDPRRPYEWLSAIGALLGFGLAHTLSSHFSERNKRTPSRLSAYFERPLFDFFSIRNLFRGAEKMSSAEFEETARREHASVWLVVASSLLFMGLGAVIGHAMEKTNLSPQPTIDPAICDSKADDQVKIILQKM